METAEKNQRKKTNKDSVKKYQQSRDAIMLRPSKADGEIIRSAAKNAGQSVQAFVLQAICERIAREDTSAVCIPDS